MKRYIATAFRGKWLYLAALTVMLAASVAGAIVLTGSQYQSTARIWIDKPLLDSVLDRGGGYGYAAPAAQQSGKLYQLVQTDSFITAIIKRTSLAGQLTGVPDHDRALFAAVRTNLAIGVLGGNTITIVFSGPDPALCQQIVQGTIDQFRAWSLEVSGEQTAVERQYHQTQLKIYEDQMNAAAKRLEEHQQKFPRPEAGSPEAYDQVRLQREGDSAREVYAAAKTKIDQASLVDTLAEKNRQAEFQVLDKPNVPQLPAPALKKLIKYLVLGFGASFGMVFAAIILATWHDTAVRTSDDLKRLTGAPVLEVLPGLRLRKSAESAARAPGRRRGLAPHPAPAGD